MDFWSKLNILQGNLQNKIFFFIFIGRQQLREEEVGKIYPAKRLTLDQLDPNPTHVQPGQFVHLGWDFVFQLFFQSSQIFSHERND